MACTSEKKCLKSLFTSADKLGVNSVENFSLKQKSFELREVEKSIWAPSEAEYKTLKAWCDNVCQGIKASFSNGKRIVSMWPLVSLVVEFQLV